MNFRPQARGPLLEFVPGWRSGAAVGEPLLRALETGLDAAGLGFAPFDARPRDLEGKAEELRARWRRAPFDAGRTLVVIGHSFGGLVAARALLDAAEEGLFDAGRRARLVAINSPFAGPRRGLATAGRLLDLLLDGSMRDAELEAMGRKSALRRDLCTRLAAAPFPVVSVSCRDDEFVSRRSARLGGRHLDAADWTGHTGPLVRPAQTESLAAALAGCPELQPTE